MAAVGVEDMLEVGSLHVGLIAVRDVKRVKQGGVSDMLGLSPQASPYCRFSLGEYEFTSGVAVRTTGGHSWNREQIFFPVKVPISCVIGGSGRSYHTAGSGSDGSSTNRRGGTKGPRKAATPGGQPKSGGESGSGSVTCVSSLSRAVAAADAAAAHGVWNQLSLRAQVFHREGGDGYGAGVGSGMTAAGGGGGKGPGGVAAKKATTMAVGITTSTTSTSKTKAFEDNPEDPTGTTLMGGNIPAAVDGGGGGGGNDRLLGECSLNLVEVVSGRAPHVEEWVPLDSEGELRLSLDYDSVRELAVPGDSVVLLCLSNRLDFFPVPVWGTADKPARPGSPSWLWPRGLSRRGGGGAGFRVEEAGDDFYLLSYSTPEGWRCAVEVHRYLVYPDPTAPQRWTLSGVRDHAAATPAAAAIREVLLRASQEDSAWEGGKTLALNVLEGVSWTAKRWWSGGLDRAREDVSFAVGLTDPESFGRSEEQEGEVQRQEQHQHREGEEKEVREDEEGEDYRDGGCEQVTQEQAERQQQQQQQVLPTKGSGHSSEGLSGNERDGSGDASSKNADHFAPQQQQQQQQQHQQQQHQHLCPITRCPMEDPAVAADGYTYERTAIERWLSEHDTSPVTGKALETKVVFKNWSLVSSSPSPSSSEPGT
ncbi:unnamed protein product [Ectocarpus sp. 12 AP-2014]